MAVISVTRLNLIIPETYNSKILAVGDASEYTSVANILNPYLEITPPSFGKQVIVFSPQQLNIFNSNTLGLTSGEAMSLPDGLWHLEYSIAPNYTVNVKKTFFKVDQFKEKFDKSFLKLKLNNCDSYIDKTISQKLDDSEKHIQIAMAAANSCNEKLAIDCYNKAWKILNQIDC